MRARLWIGAVLLILCLMAYIESINRYIETNTGVLPRPLPAKPAPRPLGNGVGSGYSIDLHPRSMPADGSSSWKSY